MFSFLEQYIGILADILKGFVCLLIYICLKCKKKKKKKKHQQQKQPQQQQQRRRQQPQQQQRKFHREISL